MTLRVKRSIEPCSDAVLARRHDIISVHVAQNGEGLVDPNSREMSADILAGKLDVLFLLEDDARARCSWF